MSSQHLSRGAIQWPEFDSMAVNTHGTLPKFRAENTYGNETMSTDCNRHVVPSNGFCLLCGKRWRWHYLTDLLDWFVFHSPHYSLIMVFTRRSILTNQPSRVSTRSRSSLIPVFFVMSEHKSRLYYTIDRHSKIRMVCSVLLYLFPLWFICEHVILLHPSFL